MEATKLSSVLGGVSRGASMASGLMDSARSGDILGLGKSALSGIGGGLKEGIEAKANALKMQSNEHLAELVKTSPQPALQTQQTQTTAVELDPLQPQRRV